MASLRVIQDGLKTAGVETTLVSKYAGKLKAVDGREVEPDKMFVTTASVEYDAVLIPGGAQSAEMLRSQGDAIHFVNEAYRHCKPIAAFGDGIQLLSQAQLPQIAMASQGTGLRSDKGVTTSWDGNSHAFVSAFVDAIAQHRHWDREKKDMVPA